jgi:hypothetical protein
LDDFIADTGSVICLSCLFDDFIVGFVPALAERADLVHVDAGFVRVDRNETTERLLLPCASFFAMMIIL